VTDATVPDAPPTPAEVIASEARRFGFKPADIIGRGRTQYLAHARAAVARALRALGLSYAEIGARLGGRDHTTILKNIQEADVRDAMRLVDARVA
jgi:chromosomal replication initiation ATPase DnaA